MGTEVLRPQDCLIERFREPSPVTATVIHRRRNVNGNFNPRSPSVAAVNNYGNRKPAVRTEKKKLNNKNQTQSEPLISRRWSIDAELRASHYSGRSSPSAGLVMGQVMILRRGESLDSLNSKIRTENQPASFKKKTVGPSQPGMSPKEIRVGFTPADMYAGSAFSNSPSPRALPLPSFFNNAASKKQAEFNSFDDSATRDLRRLLRLE